MDKPKQDSKIARMFLRMILKEQGQPVQEELEINSWDMVDLIIKNIHLVDIEVRNLRKENRRSNKANEFLRQLTMLAAGQLSPDKLRDESNE